MKHGLLIWDGYGVFPNSLTGKILALSKSETIYIVPDITLYFKIVAYLHIIC